nr:HDOD domain-containing protein [Desulfurispira natronophila]
MDASDAFPSPSGVIAEIVEVLNDPDANFDKIGRSISMDPYLSGKVLGMANSAFYSRGKECTNVQQAIMRVGMDSLSGLVLGSFAAQSSGEMMGSSERLQAFWRHCLCVALLAKKITRRTQLPHQEQAYVAGILHNIGTLAMQVLDGDSYANLLRRVEQGEDILCLERELYGIDHCELGFHVAQRWKLPKGIAIAIEGHRHVEAMAADSEYRGLAALVAMGDILSQDVFADDPSVVVVPYQAAQLDAARAVTGLDEDACKIMLEETQMIREEIASLAAELF